MEKLNLERTIGLFFLIPPSLGVIFFTINLFINDPGNIPLLGNLGSNWTGSYYYTDGGGAGFSSTAPIYLGLMAIAGAILLKNNSFKQNS